MDRIMRAVVGCAVAAALTAPAVLAQDIGDPQSPLRSGSYVAPMASYVFTDDAAYDDGYGGTLALGYRSDWWAIEVAGIFGRLRGTDYEVTEGVLFPQTRVVEGSDTDILGGTINGLLFPFSGLPNLFAIVGVGGLEVDQHPHIGRGYSLTTAEGGAGYILPLRWGNYHFGIRADARYRYGKREKRVDPGGDLPIPTEFKDVLVNLGLQLPLGMASPPPPPVEEPVQVVPVATACSDGIDNDGDGLIDYPADPGCTSPEDDDETDPPPPEPECKQPAPGEKVSLRGCGTGDVLVLRGVNFEFDRSRLTANARTILDQVAEELEAYPDIHVELGGHTDSKGSDAYNQRLSEQRAASVLSYLQTRGVAAGRMTSVGYGESRPIADNETEEGRELNRRVELQITAGVARSGAERASEASALPWEVDDAGTSDAAATSDAAGEEVTGEVEEAPEDTTDEEYLDDLLQ